MRVVAAVLYDASGRVLIAERPAGKRHAGFWEFPGGKLQPLETENACLVRELREELGIEAQHAQPLMMLQHAYPDRTVHLSVWVVERYQGEPQGREGQALQWLSVAELATVNLLPADWPIVETLRRRAAPSKLPDLHSSTGKVY